MMLVLSALMPKYNKQQDKGAIIIGVLHIHADNVSGVKQRGLMAGDRLYTIR
jgi:hypothetical protein